MADAWDQFPDAAPVAKPADPWAAFPDAAAAGPSLTDLGNAANSEIAQQPDVAKNLGERDLMSLITGKAPPAPPSQTDQQLAALGIPGVGAPATPPRTLGEQAHGALMATIQGANTGAANLAGLPVDAINAAPMLLDAPSFITGRTVGAHPISQNPVGGSQWIKDRTADVASLFGAKPYTPQGPVEDILNRTGQEIGAMAVPVGGVIAKGTSMGVQAAREAAQNSSGVISRLYNQALEAGAANPAGLIKREVGNATAAGLGAGTLNEVVGNPQEGHGNFVSDLIGSIMGTTALNVSKPILKAAGTAGGVIAGRDKFARRVAEEEVAYDILGNSSEAQRQRAAGVDPGRLDSQPLANQLRQPAEVEQVFPGYRADLAERSQDPILAAHVFNQTSLRPGVDAGRRADNANVVNDRIAGLTPDGNPGQFRQDLETGRGQRLEAAAANTGQAQTAFDQASQGLRNVMTAEGRGADIRAALEGASEQAKALVTEAWAPINSTSRYVDVAPLAENFGKIDEGLSVAERNRFRPSEAGIPDRLIGPAEASGPVNTGILDASGNPITRAPAPGNSTQPLNEVTGIRSALTDAAREAASSGRNNEARVIGDHIKALDNYLETAVPADLRQQYDTARAATRDYSDRFARPQTAIAQTLERQEGMYRQPDSAVPNKFVQSDEGRIADFEALMREAGTDNRVQGAVRDQILADVQSRGLLDKPDRLNEYLGRYGTVFGRFPELKQELGSAGALRRQLGEAQAAEKATTLHLGTPEQTGRGPVGQYLKYDDNRTVDAVRTVRNSAQPEKAANELLDVAGRTPETLNNARSAFWKLVDDEGKAIGRQTDGQRQWSGRKLSDFLEEPKNAAVAKVLYADKPEQLEDMKQVFDALASANPSDRARRANSSGTAQALNNKYDPALSAASIASRVRSVNRGVLSPQVMGIDMAATWIRGRSAAIQKRAIESLQDEVIQNPELAATLLEKYNPTDYAAKRRQIMQKFGVRATQTINLLDEAHDEQQDPVRAKVLEGADGR